MMIIITSVLFFFRNHFSLFIVFAVFLARLKLCSTEVSNFMCAAVCALLPRMCVVLYACTFNL